MLKLKLVSAIVSFSLSAAGPVKPGKKVVFGPLWDGSYAVPGEGIVPTKSCTVTADGMRARYDGKFLVFLDRHGQEEGQCEVGERPTKAPFHDEGPIGRRIGTVGP